MLGPEAEFRDGQWEAIESIIKGKRTLIVQCTGWGKSIVYFIATKILREKGAGPTLLISPLLSLIRNQIDNATRIGTRAQTINSDNVDEWEQIEKELIKGEIDILLLSPERLANQDFINRILPSIKGGIGMLVVDEAHCISDWGHDFRPDYRRIIRIIKTLPPNVPLAATTATANQRVVNDIKEQMGGDLNIIRGPLARKSLKLQVIKLKDQAERLAWLYENINKMEGSGIIYCLTTHDCNKIAKWLRNKGINVLEYHSNLSDDVNERRTLREEREQLLLNNKVKALVATVALGMGFDKPDIGFVIHFQRPGSVVKYYQEIGRAGRALDNAYAILLNGEEDDEIQEYFIKTAFPTDNEMSKIVSLIEQSRFGIKKSDILKKVNMSQVRVEKCLKLLQIDGVIQYDGSVYFRTLNPWKPDTAKSEKITNQRYNELEQMKKFVDTNDCYMEFISKQLDDPFTKKCGRCCNCLGVKFFAENVMLENKLDAIQFLKGEFSYIKPRKMWPAGIFAETAKKILQDKQNKVGKVLCTYGDAGWGKYVREDKYINNYFRDELVDACVELIKYKWDMDCPPQWVTSIPSLRRRQLVQNFAQRLANKLGLPYVESIIKVKDTPQQKSMENSYLQCKNAFEGFKVTNVIKNKPVLLVDDMVDSGWTFTVCGYLLKEKGSGNVYPFALASTSKLEGGE
ncbi:MAG: RecQ family ATP-dependent DNA helicase [Clostridiaceae bacterium]|nr:RecQ family ATP-dependent DNA helicase [Clostridiaceae bacterium]